MSDLPLAPRATQVLGTKPGAGWLGYQNGLLSAGGVSLSECAAQHGTPVFVYSAEAIANAYREAHASLAPLPHRIAYAMKANGTLAILRELKALGAAVDIVSLGELRRALKAGFLPEDVVFSGVGKRDEEIEAALRAGIRSIHVESAEEVDAIEAVASKLGARARIAFRVNPDVDPKTHPYIATGMHDAKFGIDFDQARALIPRVLSSTSLRLEGLTCHIGSQISTPEPLEQAVSALCGLAEEFLEAGVELSMIDVGGGWPMSYGDEKEPFPSRRFYGDAVVRALSRASERVRKLEVWAELGRALVGDAGILLTRVLYRKERPNKRFVIVDAGLTELIRPALYQAHHAILPVTLPSRDTAREVVDVVGPICETGDFLALDRELPRLERGALIAVCGAGAYASVMASHYNARPFAAEVLVKDGSATLIRKRQTTEELWQNELV